MRKGQVMNPVSSQVKSVEQHASGVHTDCKVIIPTNTYCKADLVSGHMLANYNNTYIVCNL